MGKVLGIIAEYNPFHNGHLYHLEEAKKQTGATYTVAIMSGNFTQRGNTALIDKWARAEAALQNGIDLVIELPLLYAISSAENFAEGAIKILDSLKVVDYLSFGSETTNTEILNTLSDVLYREPKEYQNLLQLELKKGLSFPKARENALMMYLGDIKKYMHVLSTPNNILGIEYLKAMKKYNSQMIPHPVLRYGTGYHDLSTANHIASATAIRNMVKTNNPDMVKDLVPDKTFELLMEHIKVGHTVPDLSVFEKEIIYTLRKMPTYEIADLPDVSEGLEFAIKSAANNCNSVIEFLTITKSKRYTKTRLQRILLYALLGITKKDMQLSKKITPYIRVLGFNSRGKHLISEVSKENPKLQIITSVKKFMDDNKNKHYTTMLEKDIWATDIYTLGYEYESKSNLDFTKKIVVM